MGLFKRKPKIVVHDGRFHADDVFACATIRILTGNKGMIIRTRLPQLIASGDYVMDVGGIYDPAQKRFDHHQVGGAGVRQNGIPYAAFGLVWKEYGASIAGNAEIAAQIEKRLVLPIDAADNGISAFAVAEGMPFPYLIQSAVSSFMPTWKEDEQVTAERFLELVGIAEQILRREIRQAADYVEGAKALRQVYESAEDKRVLVFDKMYPWEDILVDYPEPLLIVASRAPGRWKVESTLMKRGGFDRRMYMPKEWAGLRDADLAAVTGVPDATFCHNGRFIATARTKEGALALAQKALSHQA